MPQEHAVADLADEAPGPRTQPPDQVRRPVLPERQWHHEQDGHDQVEEVLGHRLTGGGDGLEAPRTGQRRRCHQERSARDRPAGQRSCRCRIERATQPPQQSVAAIAHHGQSHASPEPAREGRQPEAGEGAVQQVGALGDDDEGDVEGEQGSGHDEHRPQPPPPQGGDHCRREQGEQQVEERLCRQAPGLGEPLEQVASAVDLDQPEVAKERPGGH